MTVILAAAGRFLLEALGTTALLIGAWLGLLAVRARLSGWAGLARRYRARERPDGPEFRSQGARLNGWTFGRALTVRTSPRGLYLELARLSRFRHPSLLIPWARVAGLKPNTTFFGRRRLEFILDDDPACTVQLGEAAALEAKQYLPIPRIRYGEAPSRVRAPARGADAMSRPALDQLTGPAGRWLVVCVCGWTTRAPSDVVAGAAVIVHQRQASSAGKHVTAYARYHDPAPSKTLVAGDRRSAQEPLATTGGRS